MFRLSLMAAALLASTPASAGENAFNADMENPTISTVITEFEKVCFPFISHETELTPEQDGEVFQSRMVEAGYAFDSEKKWTEQTRIANFSYSWPTCEGSLSKPAAYFQSHSSKKFTVFNVDPKQIIKKPKSGAEETCEAIPHAITPVRTTIYTQKLFTNLSSGPTTALLVWQDISDFSRKITIGQRSKSTNLYENFKVGDFIPPASSCMISVNDERVTADIIENSIIKYDADWSPKVLYFAQAIEIPTSQTWFQCTHQDQENYLYSVNLTNGTFSIKVKVLQDGDDAHVYGCNAASETG